jgi:hypothetical protein
MRDKQQTEGPLDLTTEDIELDEWVRRPQTVEAVRLLEPFVVESPDGTPQQGNVGDYLVQDPDTGRRYTVDKRTFERDHWPSPPEDPEREHERREWVGLDWAGETAGRIARATLDILSDTHEELWSESFEQRIERLHLEIETSTKESGVQLILTERPSGGDKVD